MEDRYVKKEGIIEFNLHGSPETTLYGAKKKRLPDTAYIPRIQMSFKISMLKTRGIRYEQI